MLLSAAAIISSAGLIFSYLPGNGDKNNTPVYSAYGASSDTIDRFSKTKSGLVAQDPLTNDSKINTDFWTLGGSAPSMNATYSVSEDSNGLHMGVRANSSGQWAGYYAATPKSSAHLYHAVLSIPFKTVPDHWWDTGLYVQTASPEVNYVTCVALVDSKTVHWGVFSTKGDTNQATEFHQLWTDTSSNQPYTRDCTIITNGNNSLEVYLDNKLVYSNQTLDLQMPSPFRAYLETQSSISSQMLNGTYTDYYSTTNPSIKVTSVPPGIEIHVVNSSDGSVLEKGTAGQNGSVDFNVGKYHMPLHASIKAYDFSGNLVANSGAMSIWGGDEYKMSPPGSTSSNNSPQANENANNNNNGNSNKNNASPSHNPQDNTRSNNSPQANENANNNNNGNINNANPNLNNDIRNAIENAMNLVSYDGPGASSSPLTSLTLQLNDGSSGASMDNNAAITMPFNIIQIDNGYPLQGTGKIFVDGQNLAEMMQKQTEELQNIIDRIIYLDTIHLKQQETINNWTF